MYQFMRIKEECLKFFKVADANLSLKRLLALKGKKKLCANVKNVEDYYYSDYCLMTLGKQRK